MVRITIKPLSGGTFHLDAEPTDTIATLKQKINELKGHAVEQQKIIFSGKILTDEKTVGECNIKEKDFLVVMVSKPKPAPASAAPAAAKPAAAASTEGAATSSSASTAPATSELASGTTTTTPASSGPTSTPSTTTTSAPATTTTSTTTTAAPAADQPMGTSFLSGAALEEAVTNLVEMGGFQREEVMRAMRAAYNNPDRAYEYLVTGIPESANPAPAPAAGAGTGAGAGLGAGSGGTPATPARSAGSGGGGSTAPGAPTTQRTGNLFEAAAQAAQGGGAGAGAGAGGAGGFASQLAALRRQAAAGGAGAGAGGEGAEELSQAQQMLGNPAMMEQLGALLSQNPAALQPLLQQIAQANPALASALENHPEEVMGRLQQLMGPMLGAGGEEGLDDLLGEDFEGGAQQVELSEEDRNNIAQIAGMGIPEERATIAYLMCGRNVEMAIQYYFENPDEFDEGS